MAGPGEAPLRWLGISVPLWDKQRAQWPPHHPAWKSWPCSYCGAFGRVRARSCTKAEAGMGERASLCSHRSSCCCLTLRKTSIPASCGILIYAGGAPISQQWFGEAQASADCRAASLRLMAGAPQWLPEAKRSSVAGSFRRQAAGGRVTSVLSLFRGPSLPHLQNPGPSPEPPCQGSSPGVCVLWGGTGPLGTPGLI